MNTERKSEIKTIVFRCLQTANINFLPIPIEKVIFSIPHLNIVPYSVVAHDFNLSRHEVELYFGSTDGCSDYSVKLQGGVIYYNDLVPKLITTNRYRWSLAHELGHIVLKHHSNDKTRLSRNGLSNDEYNYYEEEADYFAQLILVPHACLCNFAITKPKHIELICKISSLASVRRYREYLYWYSHNTIMDSYDTDIFYWFYNYSFNRKCPVCNHVYIQRYGKYCIFCGNKLNWSSEKTMNYFKLPTYDNNKLKQCPICTNEDTDIEGEYCQICGTRLVNVCSDINCQATLPANARHCPICGSFSTFFNENILSTWQDEISPQDTETNTNSGWYLDEELPFN